jgi:hypothetical protein
MALLHLAQRHGSKTFKRATIMGRVMKIIEDIPGIERRIGRTKSRTMSQTVLNLGHERQKVGNIAKVKGLCHLCQDKFTETRELCGDDTRGIAPVIFTDAHFLTHWLAFFGGRDLVTPPLAAQFAVRVTLRLLRFVETAFLNKREYGLSSQAGDGLTTQ